MKKLSIITVILILTSCATLKPKTAKTEPPKFIKTAGYFFVPGAVEDTEQSPGSVLSEDGKFRWMPVQIEAISGNRLMLFPQPKKAVEGE